MILAEIRPPDDEFDDIEGIQTDTTHDWQQHSQKYTATELDIGSRDKNA